jgi:hypothetical protein
MAQHLEPPQQLELFTLLSNLLLAQGLLPPAAADSVRALMVHANITGGGRR